MVLAAGRIPANAQDAPGASSSQPPGKSLFNLFHPTPAQYMRELSPDRPDETESPYTVDAGHFQLEMDFANFTYDHEAGATTRAWNVAPFNVKAGLFNNVDLQFVFDSFLKVRTEDRATGVTRGQSGIGDLTTRLKVNLWGNDAGRTAFALLPFVKFPTSMDHLGNKAVEGGAIFPFAVKLPAGFEAGLESALLFLQDESGNRYHEDFIHSITFDHALLGAWSGYLEFFSDVSTERSAGWIGTVDVGLEWLLAENVQLDCGCNFGVTRAATDFHPFAGITLRF